MKIKILIGISLIVLFVHFLSLQSVDVNNNNINLNDEIKSLGSNKKTDLNLTTIKEMGNIKDISAGVAHTLVLLEDGSVYASGQNADGQLGDGTTVPSSVFVKVADNDGFINGDVNNPVIAISAGGYHSLILTKDNTVYGFGKNLHGQLGVGTSGSANSKYLKPKKVVSNQNDGSNFINGSPLAEQKIIQIEAGIEHNFILLSSGYLYSFGRDIWSQLGQGTANCRTSKVYSRPTKVADNNIDSFNDFKNGTVKRVAA